MRVAATQPCTTLTRLRSRSFALTLGASLLASATAADAGVTWGGARSGLPWASGANGGMAELESHRGRRLDFRTMYVSIDNWTNMIRDTAYARKLAAQGSNIVVGMGMLTQTHRGQHSQCGSGSFDSYIRSYGAGLVNAGEPDAILRLGWEANRMGSFPWAVTGNGSSYKACFRRWVSILRSVPGQRFTIDWNMGQKGTFPYHVDQMYPGNDVVNVIGVQNYDRCAPVRTEADWNKKINATSKAGSPNGIGSWLKYAKGKGKRLSLPEWGIGGPRDICGQPGIDNPFFLQKMHNWLRQNAGSIAYEAYFNSHGSSSASKGSHKLAPASHNPKSAEIYRSLW